MHTDMKEQLEVAELYIEKLTKERDEESRACVRAEYEAGRMYAEVCHLQTRLDEVRRYSEQLSNTLTQEIRKREAAEQLLKDKGVFDRVVERL